MKFADKVYELTKKIPQGKVTSYGEIAKALGCKAYKAVGQALNKNPYAPIVPCHRILCSNGKVGGFSRGKKEKIKLLKKEGIKIKNDKVVDFEKVFHKLK